MVNRSGFVIDFRAASPVSPTYFTPSFSRWEAVDGERVQAWCCGELLSYSADGDTAACLARALQDYERASLDFCTLNGRFCLILHDKRTREWQVITDRVGALHVYRVMDGDRIVAVGSDLATLTATCSRRELDAQAIASFLSFGFFLDADTYFIDIKILEPHSIYRISPNGELLEHRRYWTWHHTPDSGRSYAETVEEYDRLLRQAVRRCTAHGRVILPISGGLDSRSLAAVMEPGATTQCYSYGYSAGSIETWIAGQIAQARGFTFTAHVINPYLFGRLAEIARALHGSQDVTQARQCSVNAWVRERADAVLTGLWGDVWCDQLGLADGLPEGATIAQHALKRFQKRGRAWLLQHVAAPMLGLPDAAGIEAMLAEKVAAGCRTFERIADPDFQVKAYKTSRWAFRWSNASLRGFELGATPRIPYYDVDLIDFFCTVPTAFVRDRRLQIDHLKQHAPEVARIRWQAAGANLYLARYGRWLDLPRRAMRKARRVVRRERAIQRNWEVQFLNAEGKHQLETWLMRLAPDFAPAERIRELLANFYQQPDAAHGYTVSMLLTLAGWRGACR